MSGTPIARGAPISSYANVPQLSDTFTPAANSLILAFVTGNFGAAALTSITGHDGGSAWIQLGANQTYNSYGAKLWGCFSGASPSSGQVSVTFPAGGPRVAIQFIEIPDVDVSGTVLASIAQLNVAGGYSGSPITRTLTSAPTDVTVALFGTGFNQTITGSETELANNVEASEGLRTYTEFAASPGEQTHTVTTTGAAPFSSFLLEMTAGSAAPTVTVTTSSIVAGTATLASTVGALNSEFTMTMTDRVGDTTINSTEFEWWIIDTATDLLMANGTDTSSGSGVITVTGLAINPHASNYIVIARQTGDLTQTGAAVRPVTAV